MLFVIILIELDKKLIAPLDKYSPIFPIILSKDEFIEKINKYKESIKNEDIEKDVQDNFIKR